MEAPGEGESGHPRYIFGGNIVDLHVSGGCNVIHGSVTLALYHRVGRLCM